MGQAKRRKVAGTYPELTPKQRQRARIRRYRSPGEELAEFPLMLLSMLYGRKRNAELMQIQREAE